ncbi:MAG TPA: NMD3-related protein [Candidatus Margulisiibacteriota bacterium]|nr:NMD3-related protein [Candidatus Margulisiibacteriota bacterium]
MAINVRAGNKGKGKIRSLSRKGSQSGKDLPVTARTGGTPPPSVCERCGAVFLRRTWRRDRKMTDAILGRARWTVCPSCTQVASGEYFGRVLVRGAYVGANEAAIRRRIENVAARAGFTQPQRRVVSVSSAEGELEVLTTSQKLAHRIVRELTKAFRGKAAYDWSDRDGVLFATWERNDLPQTAARRAR